MSARVKVLRHILSLAWAADRRAVVLVMSLAVVNSVSVAATGASVRWLVDATRLGQLTAILLAASGGALAYAVIAAVQRVQHNLQVDLTERVDVTLSQEIFTSVAQVSTVEHLERPDYLDRLSELEKNTEALAGACWTALGTITAFVSLGLSVWLLFDVHPALSALALLAAPPLLISRRASALISRAKGRTASTVRREQRLHELCTTPEAGKELRISGSGRVLSAQADGHWETITRELAKARLQAAALQSLGWACFSFGYVGALGLVVYLISQGRGTLGGLVLVASLTGYLRGQLSATVSNIGQLAEAGHAAEQYRWLGEYVELHRHTGTLPPPTRLSQGIRLQDITFHYPGSDHPVLSGIDLELRAGSVVAIVGANGAGKTTLVKLLAGLYRPSSGQILVDGQPLSQLDASEWCAAITGAFQDYARLQTVVRETVGVGDLAQVGNRARVHQAITEAGAVGVVDQLPAGIDTQLGKIFDGMQLSHGQWQKLALARSLMRRTPLLSILDEPTAALDPQAENDLYERFVGSARTAAQDSGGIILLVSHRFSTVSMADHIVVLSGGQIREQGSHAELLADDGDYASLYQAHARGYA